MLEHDGRTLLGPALAVLCAGVTLTGCATALPFGSSTDFDRTFISAAQTWDIDKNGTVTCDEWRQYVATLLRESDANHDSALDAQEFKQMARSDHLFDAADLGYYDANSDGRVTVEELAGKQNRAFNLLDKNNDCQIDRTETVQVYNLDKPKEKETDQSIPRAGGR
ncbi:MAG: hypothetical protein WC807_02675 [Hyphomicrobium sp.]|jgi:Ca2+-binding EF-hand superfamily protein